MLKSKLDLIYYSMDTKGIHAYTSGPAPGADRHVTVGYCRSESCARYVSADWRLNVKQNVKKTNASHRSNCTLSVFPECTRELRTSSRDAIVFPLEHFRWKAKPNVADENTGRPGPPPPARRPTRPMNESYRRNIEFHCATADTCLFVESNRSRKTNGNPRPSGPARPETVSRVILRFNLATPLTGRNRFRSCTDEILRGVAAGGGRRAAAGGRAPYCSPSIKLRRCYAYEAGADGPRKLNHQSDSAARPRAMPT
ncbi:hypothetical protein EVAR_43390_1 [Eumeta japonica]|uniref:Uncharacterized protein n=1 Tax=Eumeta variegata TaxID=151549 RepID=A0A4C1WSL2_EUMVA|nr:hypothetical protein EVAR_43390_1 [Eumeta japonica]